jgi:hypothetical protein
VSSNRLSVTFDGNPVHLYRLIQGSYEDRSHYLCTHAEQLSELEIRGRISAALDRLPEEIDYDYMAVPRAPDLFEQALVLAGFTVVDDLVPLGLWLRGSTPPATDRAALKRALEEGKY